MMFFDIFALVVIAILLAVVIWLVVLLGNLPGDIARKRQHPQAEAVSALGWIGIITMGLGWFVAMVWAYYKPGAGDTDINKRVKDLESKVKALQAEGGES
ncbi:MAG: DUF3302 domain-containing protein [Xanthomonadales bacterium]|nr:DUF3302 domain-containing protein [Xanthomonadales bacterium]